MRRLTTPMKALIAVVAVLGLGMTALISVPLLMVMGNTAVLADTSTGNDEACGPVAEVAGTTVRLAQSQIANAKTIVATGQALNVPDRGLVVAVATALQESVLRNLDGGDLDSVGLFQQRNGWASKAERKDPPTAATMFYTGGHAGQPGLLDIAGWASMPITEAAQAVQVSAYPNAYAQWETLASSLVESVIGNDPLECSDPIGFGLPAGSVGDMLKVALRQVGKPYVFGATGPDSFDCSGLIVYSWKQAGYQVNYRTAAAMYNHSTPVPKGQEQPGDMLFGEFGTRVPGAGHVLIVVKPGLAVQAPATGYDVKLTNYRIPYYRNWKFARFNPDALTALGKAA